MSVDFPLPERPTMAVTVPGFATKRMSLNAGSLWPG